MHFQHYPVLLFLGFLNFLGKFEARNFLGYSVFSLSFPRILWVRQGKKILGNFEVFLDKNQKAKEKKDRVMITYAEIWFWNCVGQLGYFRVAPVRFGSVTVWG